LGRNQEPQRGITLGEVERVEDEFCLRAAWSSVGVTR
jgi:hypothetical protein